MPAGPTTRSSRARSASAAAQRRAARLVAAAAPAVGALLLATTTTVLASRVDPIGAIKDYEPSPGPSVNVAIVVSGVVAVGLVVFATTLLTSAIAGRRRAPRPPRESTLVERTTRLGSGPAGVTGLRFALDPDGAPGRCPSARRSSAP